MESTAQQEEYHAIASSFAKRVVLPRTAYFMQETIPRELFDQLGHAGYLGVNISEEYAGQSVDNVRVGLLHLAIGAACSSLRRSSRCTAWYVRRFNGGARRSSD